jgi:hypothetical protein
MVRQVPFLHDGLLQYARTELRKQRALFIYGAYGSGKRVFVDHLISESCLDDSAVTWARVNFDDYPDRVFESIDLLWREIGFSVASLTGQDLRLTIQNWDILRNKVTSSTIALDFFQSTLDRLDTIFMVVFENVHKIIDRSYVNSFFDNLRSWTEERSFSGRLGIVVSMISDTEEAHQLAEASPFLNVASRIHLLALSDRQIGIMLSTYGLDDSHEVILEIRKRIGGNLYLISALVQSLAKTKKNVSPALFGSQFEQILEAQFGMLRSQIESIDRSKEILKYFRHKDRVSIQSNNIEKVTYDQLARVGILTRENRDREIHYSLQGSCMRRFIEIRS